MRRPVRLLVSVLATILAIAGLASCGDDDADGAIDPTDGNERLVAIYAAVIEAVAAEAGPLPAEEDDPLTIYLTARGDAEIGVDVQVGVVSALEDWASVRFIDSLDEALVEDDDGVEHVRGDGLLIGLGPVTDGVATATVVADRYEAADVTTVYDIEVVRRSGQWNVVPPLEGDAVGAP